jgi:hypothetical protein
MHVCATHRTTIERWLIIPYLVSLYRWVHHVFVGCLDTMQNDTALYLQLPIPNRKGRIQIACTQSSQG